jgi:hypothetical protein
MRGSYKRKTKQKLRLLKVMIFCIGYTSKKSFIWMALEEKVGATISTT